MWAAIGQAGLAYMQYKQQKKQMKLDARAMSAGGGGGGGGGIPQLPRPGGGFGGGMGRASGSIRRGVGGALAGTAAGLAGSWVYDQFGNPVRKKRRRAKGFSGRDISQSKRIMRMLKEFQSLAPKARSAGVSRKCR